MRCARAVALVLALAGGRAAALPPPEPFAESIVELRLNGEPAPTTLIVRRDTDGTLLLRASDLPALRLRTPARGAVLVDGERHYRIGPEIGARVHFDAATLAVAVELPPAAFLTTRSTFVGPDAPPRPTSSTGAFLNYDVSVDHVASDTSGGGFLELGLFGRPGVLTHSTLALADGERTEGVRLDTTWTHDFPEHAATLRVGDAISSTGAWGRAVRFGGVQFGTNFSTQPTLVTTPLLSAGGDAVVPSTVDIFVNGQQVASESVPAGPFAIDHLPAITGSGQMQIVVTDALGRQQVVSQPYFTSTRLLRNGLAEYSVELGSVRRDYGQSSNDYGDLVGAATYRRGFSDRFTAEAHAEGRADGAQALGLDTAYQVGRAGILSATTAAGGNDDGNGWLAALGFEHDGPRFSAFARSQYTSRQFAQLGDETLEERPKQRSFAGVGYDLLRLGSLQFIYALQTHWEARDRQTLGFSYSVGLADYGFLNFFASRSTGSDERSDVLLTWTLPLGERRSLGTTLRHSSGDDVEEDSFEAVTTLQQNLPAGRGIGYSLSASSSENYRAAYAYQGHAGVTALEYARHDGQDGWRAGGVGGIAFTGAGTMLSRRLDQGFAMVQVADYEGLQVYLDNQPMGVTDRKGRVLLDGLRAYEANQVSLDPTTVPMDAALETPSVTVTPAYRSGVLVEFPVRRADSVTLRLVQPNATPVPTGSQVQLAGASFPVGFDGRVQLNGVSGRTRGIAEWRNGRCDFEVERPAGNDPMPDLGTVTCGNAAPGEPRP